MTLPGQFAAAEAMELGREMSWESSHIMKAQKYWECHFAAVSLAEGNQSPALGAPILPFSMISVLWAC